MTIESIITAQTMIGDGVNRHWPFTFKAWEGEIRAVVLSGHLETDVTADCDITLNSGPGGLVVYPRLAADAPLPAGVKITILRDMDFLQNTELVNAARFDPHVIEEQFDRLVAEDQQLLEGLGRALQVAPGESAPSISAFLAGVDDAANSAQTAAEAAGESAAQAGASAGEAEEAAVEAGEWSELARRRAENPEDEAVAGGGFSSLHWAEKARHSAAEAEAIKEEIESLQGVVTYLDGHDFGDPAGHGDWQQALTDYALAQAPGWTAVPNSCDVVNLWDGHEWIYNIATGQWIDFGSATVTEATSGTAGIVKADVAATPGTVILRDADGRARISAPALAGEIATKGYVDGAADGAREYADGVANGKLDASAYTADAPLRIRAAGYINAGGQIVFGANITSATWEENGVLRVYCTLVSASSIVIACAEGQNGRFAMSYNRNEWVNGQYFKIGMIMPSGVWTLNNVMFVLLNL